MIDFHSHILPYIDDGSKSIQQSDAMLELLCASGVKKVVFTPHFYPYNDDLDRFLHRRDEAYKKLLNEAASHNLDYVLGAEVLYYKGISRSNNIKKLCIEGTDLLLLEMPFFGWNSNEKEEIECLVEEMPYTVILAHIERYIDFEDNFDFILDLKAKGLITQINASFVAEKRTTKKAIKLIKNGCVDIIASDSHDLDSRRPQFKEAFSIIEKKLNVSVVERLMENSDIIFREHSK